MKTTTLGNYARRNNNGSSIHRPPSPEQQQVEVDRWNIAHSIGDTVKVRLDDGTVKQTITESDAWLLGGHTAVILLKGITGGYMLSRVSAA